MSGKYKLAKALVKTQVVKQDVQEEIPAVLGITIKGKKTVEVPSRPGYLYARIHGNLSELVQAYNDQVSPVYDLRVLLIRDKVDKSRFRIKGRDLGTYQNWGATSYLPKHGAQHSFNPDTPGGDIVWVWGKQFMPLMAVPSGSAGGPNVVIYGSPFQVNGDWAFAGDTGTVNIIPDMKPTGAWARMVLVFVDQYGNPQVTGSSTYFDPTLTGTSAILPYVPDIDASNNVPIAAIRLVSGTSIINWDNIYDFRTHYSMNNGVGHIIQDDGVSLTQRNYLNFEGAGFVVYDSAGKTNVSGTASGAGGHVIQDDGVAQPAEPALNFVGNGFVVYDSVGKTNVSGTAYVPATYTPNRVMYSNAGGIPAVDNYFRYSHALNSNNMLIGGLGVIGTLEPFYNIVSVQDYSDISGSWNDCYAAFSFDNTPSFHFFCANGFENAPTKILNGDITAELGFYHFGTGTGYCTFGLASYIREQALGSQIDAYGSEFSFGVTTSGTSTMREALKLRSESAWFYKNVIADHTGSYYWGSPLTNNSMSLGVESDYIGFRKNISGVWKDSYFKYRHNTNFDNLIIGGLGTITNFETKYNVASIMDYNGLGSFSDCFGAFAFDNTPSLHFFRANYTEAYPRIATNSDELGEMGFYSYASGTAYCTYVKTAYIRAKALGSQSDDVHGSEFTFGAMVSGTATTREALKLWAEQAWFYKDVIAQNGGSYYFGDPRLTGSMRIAYDVTNGMRIQHDNDGVGNWSTNIRTGLSGNTRIGNATGSYTNWDKTGHQTMIGDARPWRDALGELLGKKRNGIRITEDLAEGTLLFADNCILADDYVITNIQFNHDRDPSSIISPHLHWFQASATMPNWIIQYRWQLNGNPKVTGWTSAPKVSNLYTYTAGTLLQITEFPDITPPTGTNISDIVQFRLTRDTNNDSAMFSGTDALAGNVAALMFDCHLQISSIGSTEEFVK